MKTKPNQIRLTNQLNKGTTRLPIMIAQAQNYYQISGSTETLKKVSDSKEAKVVEMSYDSQQWDDFREGDELVFGRIYEEYVDVLFNYGKRFSSDRELVKDCVQDFFLYLREKREGIGATTSIKFYLLRSFRRRLLKYITKKEKTQQETTSELEFQIEVQDCSVQSFIENEANNFMVKKLNKSLEQLTAKEREAVFFYYYEGIGYKEIADIMEFSHVSSARRLIYTALNNLKDILHEPVH
ncbi:RNA polymerase sigma factor [Marinoscillum sp. MHG1-6]|uniref:RNA polymerase sigma factor n=1 Tax=Marinoscillum sp. MHG1-6 TaxID=2959627 RepID=UPI0021580C3E|nr:sigma-70 family RNA polymerase sigma factor [Marinoscillum sp. MHG1-6]